MIEIVQDRGIKIASLGPVLVPGGLPAELVGDLPHAYGPNGLDPARFQRRDEDPFPYRLRGGFDDWPKKDRELELSVVNFGRRFANYSKFLESLTMARCPLGSFPEICAIKHRAPELWNSGIERVTAAHPDALWRDCIGNLYVPCLRCYPDCRLLDADWVGRDRGDDDWCLVVGKYRLVLGSLESVN